MIRGNGFYPAVFNCDNVALEALHLSTKERSFPDTFTIIAPRREVNYHISNTVGNAICALFCHRTPVRITVWFTKLNDQTRWCRGKMIVKSKLSCFYTQLVLMVIY